MIEWVFLDLSVVFWLGYAQEIVYLPLSTWQLQYLVVPFVVHQKSDHSLGLTQVDKKLRFMKL